MTRHGVGVRSMGLAATAEQKRVLRSAVRAALESERVDRPCSVEIYTTTDEGIHALNLERRGIDRATDVLSFPMLEHEPGEPIEADEWDIDENGRVMLGEMVISLERAAAQAEEYGHSETRELAFLAVHSTLHLLGYDHERGEEDERTHFRRQEEILDEMGITRGDKEVL